LFLHERSVPDEWGLPPEAMKVADQRARGWSEAAGADEEIFLCRLAAADLTWEKFVRILAAHEAEQEPSPADESAYAWWRVIEEIQLGTYADVAFHQVRWRNPDGTEGTEPPFGSFLRPFLQCGVGRLRKELAAIEAQQTPASPLIDTWVESQFVLHLIERLSKQCSSTLILELNVARLRGHLPGDTPSERFRYFSERYFTPAAVLGVLREYPVLGRLLSLTVCRWTEVTLEFFARLAADRHLIGEALGSGSDAAAESLGTLGSVQLGVSDLHRGGRSVVIAEDVHGRRVVYKPVQLAVDAQMQRLVNTVNGFGLRHSHRTIRVMDRGEYGWIEYVQTEGCTSFDELHRFYWRQGSLIALLHLVRGADFHHENVLATGEYPVLVDNEALFHHRKSSDAAPKTARQEAEAELRRSVLRQSLLPHVYRLTPREQGVDHSGLGGAGGQVATGAVRRWADPGTDQMRVVPADMVTQEARNRPSFRGAPADALDFLTEIIQGFSETYDAIAAHKDELRPLLDGFAGTMVRHLIRATRQYAVFLREGNHPNDLRDGLSRDELLDRLWARTATAPELRRIIPSELEDLRTGDIPVFFARPDSVHLWDSRGRCFDDFFVESSLQEAHRQLTEMSEEDRERQVLLIRMAISEARSRARESDASVGGTEPRGGRRDGPSPLVAPLEEVAVRVGDALKSRALISKRGVCWISVDPFVNDSPGGDRPRNIAVAKGDLYHGSAGIGLFLGYLGAETGRGDFTELARGAVLSVREAMALTGPFGNQAVGAYVGRASYSYALQHLAALWSEPTLLDAALMDVPNVQALIPADREFDLLGGSAGCAVVMLQLHEATGDPAALRAARSCGEHLLANAQPVRGGIAWTGSSFAGPVAGLSHGAAGIAWALFTLAAATGDERYRAAAVQALAFERNLLEAPEATPFHARVSWCHGLPSVALARILSLDFQDDLLGRREIEEGVNRLLRSDAPVDPCLCHGVLGNAEILAAAGRRLGVVEWNRAALEWAVGQADSIAQVERDPYLPLHARFAGLMCGFAGVGWALLRSARPGSIPSVLMLEPPR
jgi:type 2 lantibiotic biosynthesis protein LanM